MAPESDAHLTSDNAMLAQMMEMMKNITTRLEALKTRSPNPTPTYPILPSAPATSAPQPQSQSQSTLSITQPISQQKKKRNEKTRQQYKRRTLQQANTEIIAKNIAKESISSSNNKASSIKTMDLLSTIPVITPWFRQPHHYIVFISPPAYIQFAKDMKTTGQG